VPVAERHFKLLSPTVSRYLAPTYAWAYAPEEAWRREGSEAKPKLWFVSCAYLEERNADWVPTFLADMSIMQPINAQIQADFLADMLKGGAPDGSRPEHLANSALHGILSLAEQVYVPFGKEECRWIGTGEFVGFAEKYALNDNCFGFGSETGLTVETPFGSVSALIRLRTDEKHPALGNGLLATLQMPFFGQDSEIASECAWLNFLESVSWTNVPVFGCWHPHEYGPEEGQVDLAFTSFVPNAHYRLGLATHVALWMISRAWWLRQTRWPDLEDKTMMEIMQGRVGFPSS
jgi:hypothetical protein